MISGNMEHAMMIHSTAPLPLNLSRASAYAAMMPNNKVNAVVIPEIISELINERPKLFCGENTAWKFSTEIGLGMNSVHCPSAVRWCKETTIQ